MGFTGHGKFHSVLKAPKKESKLVASEVLNKFPVDDILIDEPEVEDIIRNVFEQSK